MDRNIVMAIMAVALIALIFIGIAVFKKKPVCPTDVSIKTAQTSYEIGEQVHFSVAALGKLPENSTYQWHTKDGQKSKEPAPTFTFKKAGEQDVEVRINEGCRYKLVVEVTDTTVNEDIYDDITIVSGEISVSKKEACVSDVLEFNDNTQDASAWWWDFGDANTSVLPNPRHTYKNPGTYTVKRMLNGEGELTSTLTVTVKDCKKPIPINTGGSTNIATFGIRNPNARAGEMVYFNDQTPNATSWLWNFGDNYTSQERNPAHVYNYAGNYRVTLSVNGTGRNVATRNISIAPAQIVTPPPPPPVVAGNERVADDIVTSPPSTILPAPTVDLATNLKNKFQEIAISTNSEQKTNIYYNDLLPNIADEEMTVQIVKSGIQIEKSFHDYYNNLNIQGGQRIRNVQVLGKDASGKATGLKITEQ